MRIVYPKEMKEIDELAISEFGLSEQLIIENVGIRGADLIEERVLSEHSFGEVVVLVGPGNNGADGLAIARHLTNRGQKVRAFVLFPDEMGHENLVAQLNLARAFGVKVSELREIEQLEGYLSQTQEHFLMIDAILGTGVRLPLSSFLLDVINFANQHASVMVSIDIATGITGDTGTMSGSAILADLTLAIALPKAGHFFSHGAIHSGEVIVMDVGIPSRLLQGGDKSLLLAEKVTSVYGGRDKFAHKNAFGHCLVVGGSKGLTGALIMASTAALKVGTGLVTASTWEESYYELCTRTIPEIMTGLIPTDEEDVDAIIRKFGRYDALVMGPGLGRDEDVRGSVVKTLMHFQGPMVLDADAIRALSLKEDRELLQRRKAPTILTPHMGEFAAFLGIPIKEILERPLEYLKEAVDQINCTIILKGPCTAIAFPDGQIFINYFPNDGMASGGAGDVLAGILGGLLAQNATDPHESALFAKRDRIYDAILLGVVTHTLAGKHAAEKLGARAMTAGSIIEHLGDAFSELAKTSVTEVD
jgi:NAD(P)H-hydrate epimerase